MFSSLLKSFVVVSFVAALSVSALPRNVARDDVFVPHHGAPVHISSASDLCHCEKTNNIGQELVWAEGSSGKYHFNCHYGHSADDSKTECGYSLVSPLLSERPI